MKTGRNLGQAVIRSWHRHDLLRHLSEVFAPLAMVRGGKRAGRWSPILAALAMCLMAWSTAPAMMDRFAQAQECLHAVAGRACRRRLGRSYNGLLEALCRHWPGVRGLVLDQLRHKALVIMHRMHRRGWIVLAVDGSRVELPRTRDNERRFGTSDNGVAPQAYVTVIVHVLTGLLWDWRIGPARSSERGDLSKMIGKLPERTLLLMDGYYVGYELWNALISRQVHFLMRVGGNVRLLHELIPGRHTVDRKAGIVYVWRNERTEHERPMRLRLITLGRGSKRIYLLTTVLEPERLSRARAGELYRLRWEIELVYRSLKQTLGAEKAKSRTAARAEVEINWTLIAVAVLTLLATTALAAGRLDPSRWSFAGALRIVRQAARAAPSRRPLRRGRLMARLAAALKDDYQRRRSKRSRHRPRTVNTPATTQPPRLQRASKALQCTASRFTPIELAA